MEAETVKRITLFIALLFSLGMLSAELISIGNGTVLNQGLPIEPIARYSYSQQIFLASEIGVGGYISAIQFQYNVVSQAFYAGNSQLKVFIGHTTQSEFSAWHPASSMTLAFDGVLPEYCFLSGLPGTGWVDIPLSMGFQYDGSQNLIIGVAESSHSYGNSSDDFYCQQTNVNRSIQFQSAAVNPDPYAPPTTGFNLKTHRSNLRISIQAQHYFPVQPSPANNSSGIGLNPQLSWYSICSSFNLAMGTRPDSLVQLVSGTAGTSWQLEYPLQHNTRYYWQVTGFHEANSYPSPIWSFLTLSEAISPPQNLSGVYNGTQVALSWQAPASGNVSSYNVYRNNFLLANTAQTSYSDANVVAGFTYYYHVCALSATGSESTASVPASVFIPNNPPNTILNQGFESCEAFSTIVPGWQTIDIDGSPTWTWEGISYPHAGEAQSWLCFAPGQTVPPLSGFVPYSGLKMLMAMSSLSPPNNDWLISPPINLGSDGILSFKARSAVADYGLERLRLLVSTSDSQIASFTAINDGAYIALPAQWTHYSYDLAAYTNRRIFLAFQCVSVDAFALLLDDILLTGTGGWVSNEDYLVPPPAFSLFPNPAHNSFVLANKSGTPYTLEIFDLRGRKIYAADRLQSFSNLDLPTRLASGIYLYRITQNGSTYTIKQVILK